jgi:hypothetical protein
MCGMTTQDTQTAAPQLTLQTSECMQARPRGAANTNHNNPTYPVQGLQVLQLLHELLRLVLTIHLALRSATSRGAVLCLLHHTQAAMVVVMAMATVRASLLLLLSTARTAVSALHLGAQELLQALQLLQPACQLVPALQGILQCSPGFSLGRQGCGVHGPTPSRAWGKP